MKHDYAAHQTLWGDVWSESTLIEARRNVVSVATFANCCASAQCLNLRACYAHFVFLQPSKFLQLHVTPVHVGDRFRRRQPCDVFSRRNVRAENVCHPMNEDGNQWISHPIKRHVCLFWRLVRVHWVKFPIGVSWSFSFFSRFIDLLSDTLCCSRSFNGMLFSFVRWWSTGTFTSDDVKQPPVTLCSDFCFRGKRIIFSFDEEMKVAF